MNRHIILKFENRLGSSILKFENHECLTLYTKTPIIMRSIHLFSKHQIFGYDCEHGHCMELITGNDHTVSTIVAISHWMPCSIMVLSYSVIWVHIWTHGKYLKKIGRHEPL